MIRRAVPEDAADLARLINAINALGSEPPDPPMSAEIVLRDLICDRPRAQLWVAAPRQKPVGFVTAATIYDAARAGDAVMLLDLYVAPEWRRRGLARALMARLAAEACNDGARCLWWGVDEGDDEATLFYRAIGARSEGLFSGEIIDGAALDALAGCAA